MSDLDLQLQQLEFVTMVENGREARKGSVVWCDQLDNQMEIRRRRRRRVDA